MEKSEIKINVVLDDNKIPEKMSWKASNKEEPEDTKAIFLSVWDEEKGTMKVDLWTKEMKVDEMKFFVHQSIYTMAESFEKATGEVEMSQTMKDFCDYFAEKMELKK